MKRRASLAALALFLVLAATLPAQAKTFQIIVPPNTVSATINIIGQNTSGAITSQKNTSFCPAGNTVTVNLPNDTAATQYTGQAFFQDGQGNLTGFAQVDNDTGGGENQYPVYY